MFFNFATPWQQVMLQTRVPFAALQQATEFGHWIGWFWKGLHGCFMWWHKGRFEQKLRWFWFMRMGTSTNICMGQIYPLWKVGDMPEVSIVMSSLQTYYHFVAKISWICCRKVIYEWGAVESGVCTSSPTASLPQENSREQINDFSFSAAQIKKSNSPDISTPW